MGKLFFLGAALVLLDVFPGGCSCSPSSTVAGPCTDACACPALNAPIKCPGQWLCNGSQRCEYACSESCLDDGGCATTTKTCNASSGLCLAPTPSVECR